MVRRSSLGACAARRHPKPCNTYVHVPFRHKLQQNIPRKVEHRKGSSVYYSHLIIQSVNFNREEVREEKVVSRIQAEVREEQDLDLHIEPSPVLIDLFV